MRIMLIKDLGKIVTGNTPSKSEPEFYNSNDIHFIKPDLIGNSGITQINHSKEYISEKARKKARVVRKNTVLVTCVGNIGKVGYVAVDEVAFNQQINAIIPNDKVLPRYLAYAIVANQKRLEDIANAPVVPIINKTQFENFDISIHEDLKDQDEIAKILDNLSKEIKLRNKKLSEYDQLIKSRFVEMFGTPGKNEKGWILGSISDIGRCVAGATPSTKVNEYWENGTIPWMSSGEVNKGRIYDTDTKISELGYKNASTKLVPPHTVVLAMAGQGKTRGTVAITEIELCTNQSLCSIVNNEKIDSEYLLMYLRMQYEELRNVSNGAEGRGGLNLKIIGNFPIMIPPIEHQIKFASIVKQVDKLKFEVQKSLNETQMLFDSLMQEYFG